MKRILKTMLSILKYWFFLLQKRITQAVTWFSNNICRITHKAPDIMSREDTVQYILENRCSISRFGDGEIVLMTGKDLSFQKYSDEIGERLRGVLHSNSEKLLVCIPSVFTNKQRSDKKEKSVHFWKWHLNRNRKNWYKYLNEGQVYGDSLISRPYIDMKDKSGCAVFFDIIKKLWENRDIIIVEGEKSRLGVGNNLFDGASNVKRILGPSREGFSKYNELIDEIKKHAGKDTLILLALGPTASVMAQDLCSCGYQTVDIGNIDLEYEWFLMGADEKVPLKNKIVYESREGKDVGDIADKKYIDEIVARII